MKYVAKKWKVEADFDMFMKKIVIYFGPLFLFKNCKHFVKQILGGGLKGRAQSL